MTVIDAAGLSRGVLAYNDTFRTNVSVMVVVGFFESTSYLGLALCRLRSQERWVSSVLCTLTLQ